jgi:hypothetical protein
MQCKPSNFIIKQVYVSLARLAVGIMASYRPDLVRFDGFKGVLSPSSSCCWPAAFLLDSIK